MFDCKEHQAQVTLASTGRKVFLFSCNKVSGKVAMELVKQKKLHGTDKAPCSAHLSPGSFFPGHQAASAGLDATVQVTC